MTNPMDKQSFAIDSYRQHADELSGPVAKNLTVRHLSVRNMALSLLLAAGAFAAPASAQINFNINLGPPPPQQEVVPGVPPGYVWAPGYWGWSGERHVWVRGRPIVQREGFLWQPDRWEHRDGKYFRTAGHWERDRDFKRVKVKKEKKHKDRGNNKHDS